MSTPRLRLPNFCAGESVMGIVLISLLTATILSLARQTDLLSLLWLDLARTMLLLLWIGLGSAGVLCLLRDRLHQLPVARASALAMSAIVFVVIVISLVVYALGRNQLITFPSISAPFAARPLAFVVTNVVIGAVVGAAALRYFFVLGQWQRNVELQARARVHALQARIRPHFLYNSMNTIAALIRRDATQAEDAVQDLADLFRANLSETRSSIPLKEELEVARAYQRIEQARLGDRLTVVWDVTALPMRARVPSLLVQPLLENAIYHGVEPRTEGGTVTVSGELDGQIVRLMVKNPLPDSAATHNGNGIALDNIRERLQLLYPGQASVEAGVQADEFVVQLTFPYQEAERTELL